MRLGLFIFAIMVAAPATAQINPWLAMADPRIQTIDYQPARVFRLQATLGYQVTVELAPDEQIQSIAVGESSAWQVTASRGGNRLFVKSLEAGIDTNMTVITSARTYTFDLTSQGAGIAPYYLRFRYPPEVQSAGPLGNRISSENQIAVYRISGARELRPAHMSDDGEKTYIEWGPDTPLPAVFIIDDRGREILANGNMRDGIYVIDSVYPKLLFRVDRATVRASRYIPKKPTP